VLSVISSCLLTLLSVVQDYGIGAGVCWGDCARPRDMLWHARQLSPSSNARIHAWHLATRRSAAGIGTALPARTSRGRTDLPARPPSSLVHAGAFYLGYGVAHVPSTCATMQLGARWWFGTMTIAWGIVATSAAAIRSRTGLVLQRLLLGITEAGAAGFKRFRRFLNSLKFNSASLVACQTRLLCNRWGWGQGRVCWVSMGRKLRDTSCTHYQSVSCLGAASLQACLAAGCRACLLLQVVTRQPFIYCSSSTPSTCRSGPGQPHAALNSQAVAALP
jgi:hypothetical protein